MSLNRNTRRRAPMTNLLGRMFDTPLCILPAKMETIVAAIGPRLIGGEILSAYQPDNDDQDDDYAVLHGVAILNIGGTLVRHTTGMDAQSGLTSYATIATQFSAAMRDAAVSSILLRLDSPGGEVSGCFDLVDAIYSNRAQKPIVAVVDDSACSAAYAIASAADQIIVSRTSVAGSIGCFILHLDRSGQDTQEGLKYTYIFAGENKVSGNEHEPLNSDARDTLQKESERIRAIFAQTVARNRGLSVAALLETEAAVKFGPDNIPLFADQLGTFDDAVRALANLSGARRSLPPRSGALIDGLRQPLSSALPATFNQSDDAMIWLATCSNLPGAGPAIAQRLHAEEIAARAKYGQNVEARLIAFQGARADAAQNGQTISMLVVPYNGLSLDLGAFRERYAPGCFRRGLDNDPRALFNHNEEKILGRASAGTARFWDDSEGVHCEATGPAGAGWFDDMIKSMRRGDTTGASAAFWILKQHNETGRNGERIRVVDEALLREASVCGFPAYSSALSAIESAPPAAAIDDNVRLRLERMKASMPAETSDEFRLRLLQMQ